MLNHFRNKYSPSFSHRRKIIPILQKGLCYYRNPLRYFIGNKLYSKGETFFLGAGLSVYPVDVNISLEDSNTLLPLGVNRAVEIGFHPNVTSAISEEEKADLLKKKFRESLGYMHNFLTIINNPDGEGNVTFAVIRKNRRKGVFEKKEVYMRKPEYVLMHTHRHMARKISLVLKSFIDAGLVSDVRSIRIPEIDCSEAAKMIASKARKSDPRLAKANLEKEVVVFVARIGSNH